MILLTSCFQNRHDITTADVNLMARMLVKKMPLHLIEDAATGLQTLVMPHHRASVGLHDLHALYAHHDPKDGSWRCNDRNCTSSSHPAMGPRNRARNARNRNILSTHQLPFFDHARQEWNSIV